MSTPETTQALATHLRRMADNAGDQIDADRLSRAADLVEAPARICELEEALITVCQRETAAHYRHDARIEVLEAERDALLPWAKLGAACIEGWPGNGDLDGFQLKDMAESAGVLTDVPGGFDPEEHDDRNGAAEQGDPWFLIQRLPKALRPMPTGGSA